MKIDLRCPVEVRKCELTLFDRGLPRAYIQLFNLANAAVSSIEGVAHWLGNDGSEVEIRPFSVETPRAYARSAFSIALSPQEAMAADIEIVFTRVCFAENGPDWIAESGVCIELPPPEPLSGQEEAALVRLAGQGATQYAQLIPGAWICVCGRANALDAGQCVRCMRDREVCLTRFTRSAARYKLPPLPTSIHAAPPEPEFPFPLEQPQAKNRRSRSERAESRRFWLAIALLALAILLGLLAASVDGWLEPSVPTPPPGQMVAKISYISYEEVFQSIDKGSEERGFHQK